MQLHFQNHPLHGHSYCESQNKEDFNVFFKKFASDSTFQKTRVVFPLDFYSINNDNFEIEKEIIKKDQYKVSKLHLGLIKCSESYTVFYDNFELKFNDTGKRVFQWKGFTGMDERCYFERIKGKWFLIKIENLGT